MKRERERVKKKKRCRRSSRFVENETVLRREEIRSEGRIDEIVHNTIVALLIMAELRIVVYIYSATGEGERASENG